MSPTLPPPQMQPPSAYHHMMPAPLHHLHHRPIGDFWDGKLVGYPPPTEKLRNMGHLLRLQSLADDSETAQNTLAQCVDAVRAWVDNTRCRADALIIMDAIVDTGASMSHRWRDIVLYNIKHSPMSTRGNKRAPDSRTRLHRANEIFLRDYGTKLAQRVANQHYISLNDVLAALMLLGRIAQIPSM